MDLRIWYLFLFLIICYFAISFVNAGNTEINLLDQQIQYSGVSPLVSSQKCYGGSYDEVSSRWGSVSSYGSVLAGSALSDNGDVSGNHGGLDYWIVKQVKNNPNSSWMKCYGGSGHDYANDILNVGDSYIVVGDTRSNNGDITGYHGDTDIWVIKLDLYGNIIWQKCLGGTGFDSANSVAYSKDGHLIIAGATNSNDGDVSGNHGGMDAWLVVLDLNGKILFQKCYGGTGFDRANSVKAHARGLIVMAGDSNSNDGDVSGNHGGYDAWIVATDENGNFYDQICMGGSGTDAVTNIYQEDGDKYIYTFAGYSDSKDTYMPLNKGGYDFYLMKLNVETSHWEVLWEDCRGGSADEYANSIIAADDGDYIVVGYTKSNDCEVSGNHGADDIWVIKYSPLGYIKWQRCLGGVGNDYLGDIKAFAKDYYIFGTTFSYNGDVSGNHGGSDYWVVNLAVNDNIITDFTFTPNVTNVSEPVFFSANIIEPNYDSVLWNFGDGSPTATTLDTVHRFNLPGVYNVTLTVINQSENVTVNHIVPVRGLIPDFEIYPTGGWAVVNTPVIFKDTSKGDPVKWFWNFGDGTNLTTTVNPVNHTYNKTGTYTVNMKAKNWQPITSSAPSKQLLIVNKSVPREVNFYLPEMKQTGKAPFSVQFEDGTPVQYNVSGWFWDFGDGSNSIEQAPEHTYTIPGQYTVILTVRNEMGTNEVRKVAYIAVL